MDVIKVIYLRPIGTTVTPSGVYIPMIAPGSRRDRIACSPELFKSIQREFRGFDGRGRVDRPQVGT